MATIKYFNGEIELTNIHGMDNTKFAAAFPTTKGYRYDGFQRLVGYPVGAPRGTAPLAVERRIEYKAFASKHECDVRCINATGRTMQCECSCGGKNHGRGAFNCSVAA